MPDKKPVVAENDLVISSDPSILTGKDYRRILDEFNGTFTAYPLDKGLMDLWDEQVELTPDALALFAGGRSWTWRELDGLASKLALYLHANGVRTASRVPICIDRSVEMILAILAILKTGAAYVPIDPDYPEERVQYILDDIGAETILADKGWNSRFPGIEGPEPLRVDAREKWEGIHGEPVLTETRPADGNRIICVIYTSGSTGKPKGVMVTQKGIVNRLYWMWDKYPFRPDEKVAWKTSLSFVDHVWEIFGALTYGIPSVLLTREDILDPDLLIERLGYYKITRWVLVPSLLRSLLAALRARAEAKADAPAAAGGLEALWLWTSSGEILPADLVSEFYALFPRASHKLLNIYGSTEVTADVTCYDCSTGSLPAAARMPIGKPIANCKIYIRDEQGHLADIGTPGEICVGGIQVASGYWNRPALTEEKFVKDIYPDSQGKLYRTGDIGRWMPDGNIEYLGRMDQQVKIRGYRVELGEIETVLQQSGLVRQVVVLAKEDAKGNKRLLGYVVGDFDRTALIDYLSRRLPEYMVPLVWVGLDSLPLTVNGKIDKLALPEPSPAGDALRPYIPPRNEVEATLVRIWEELLGPVRPGIHDNFFEIGGDSILTMRLITLIRRALKAETTIRILFEYPTIAGQASFILQPQEEKQRSIDLRTRTIIGKDAAGSALPFFAMPDRMTYDKLATYLPASQPLYCLEMIPEASIEENARHFISEIKTIQPHGPYNLGGHCGAGLIALEMGRQLMAAGEKMHLLVLFESYGPEAVLPWTSPRYWMGKVRLYQGVMSNLPFRQKIVFPFKEIKRIYKGTGEFDKEYKSALKPYPGDVLLFRASIQDTYYHKDDPLMGWDGHILGNIESVEIEGDHLTIIHEEPGVAQIAEKLKKALPDIL